MKKRTYIGLSFAALIALASCNNASKTGNQSTDSTGTSVAALNQLTSNKDAEKLHLYFHLEEKGQTDSSVVYQAKSLYNQDTVGFNVEVVKDIAPGVTATGGADENAGFREGAVKISSLGPISDNFVKSLGDLMKLPTDGKMSSSTLLPLVFSSNKDKVDLSKSATYSFKYFFENGTGTPAELFGVVDTYKKSFELTEKDSTYRKAVIASFEGK